MAVRVRCCRYGIGAYWLGTAVQVRTGKVFTGLVSSGWAGSVQRIGRVYLVRKDGVWQSRIGLFRCDAERHDKDGQSWCVMDCRDRMAIGPV
jgi:hypothetical protein